MATVQHANFIQYGRRTGLPKSAPTKRSGSASSAQNQELTVGVKLADGTDLRQVKVLPRREWNRIQESLHSNAMEIERIKEARANREALHAQSKEIVQNWSNTIVGQRQKKLQARKLREEKEEEGRVKLDIEEAKYQAEKRKQAIDKAKTIQYFQTDRIKSFHGALLLTEVLKERDAQVELKKQKEAQSHGKDHELLKHYRAEYERGILEDQHKASKRYQERQKVAEYQAMQIKEHVKQQDQEALEDKKEGEEVRKLARLHEWEQKKLEQVRRQEKMLVMQSHKEHEQNKAAIRALEEQQEEEENEEIRLFAAAKKKMLRLRKQKEAELFKEVQDHKNKMTNLLAAQLKQKVDDEDSRIIKATKEKEEKLAKERDEKQQKLKKALKSIAEHRDEQLTLKERQEKMERRKALEQLAVKVEADRVFNQKQYEKAVATKEHKKQLQAFHMAQINDRAEKERQNREEELHHDEQLVNLLSIEEEQFQEYANKVISAAKKKGQNPYPLTKAAQAGAGGGRGPTFDGKGGLRPSYMTADGYGVQLPNCQRSTTESIKSKCESGNATVAKKRLGFVW
uniref:coiled-coil domain-containing protein 173 n=1 Tax=Ciona intestinalis TaxID=7719 RepID=UPI0000522404|nr:coiled-coil domain-containing protein 173 [Ciona intestinalis]|eukprot:XP_002128435.1 coiled-coil domain-containing protein 173 [Ciona intestinalis]